LARIAYELAAKDAAWPKLPILMADLQTGEIVYCSPFAAHVFGYEPAELLGGSVEELVMPELREAHARWRQDASVPKTRLMGVGRHIIGRRKDGTPIPVHIGLTAARVTGRDIGVAFVIDLTGIIQLRDVSRDLRRDALRDDIRDPVRDAARDAAHGGGE
jgi:PAS domain S-box-containing protein